MKINHGAFVEYMDMQLKDDPLRKMAFLSQPIEPSAFFVVCLLWN